MIVIFQAAVFDVPSKLKDTFQVCRFFSSVFR